MVTKFPDQSINKNVCVRQEVKKDDTDKQEEQDNISFYINVFRLKIDANKPKLQLRTINIKGSKVHAVVHNSLCTITANTGASISPSGTARHKSENGEFCLKCCIYNRS